MQLGDDLRVAREAVADPRADGIAEVEHSFVGDEVVTRISFRTPAGDALPLQYPQVLATACAKGAPSPCAYMALSPD